jgi:PTH1 family peptidyl-tRNA hydrolase
MCDAAQPSPHPRLIIGLGNPGAKYRENRHNLGFKVAEALAAELGLAFAGGQDRYLATSPDTDPVLLKPLTYMNLSGQAVAGWLAANNPGQDADPSRILVVCDDLALPLGTMRLRGKGSSGGQNGLASVIEELGSESFPRLRLGIDGTEGQLQPEQWPDYVLADFEAREKETADLLVERAVQAVRCWLESGVERAASRYNGSVLPPVED